VQASFRVFPLERVDEELLLGSLDEDRVLHIFTIYDLKYMRDRTEVWVALRHDEIGGYLMEFDKRIVYTHGDPGCVAGLLRFVGLDETRFVVEPNHLPIVEKIFKPVKPTDSSSRGKITTYFVMRIDAETFRPVIGHHVRRLGTEDLDEVLEGFGEDLAKTVKKAVKRGVAFGAYDEGSLASLATVPQIIENLALIRGVYT
jgi:hypothetical protein